MAKLPTSIALAVCVVLVLGGCQRLTFVKPNPNHRGYTQVAPDYDVSGRGGSHAAMSVANQLRQAEQHLLAGQLAEAERLARAALRVDARSADAYTLLGAIADAQGQSRQAGDHYARALQLAPNQGVALNNRAVWLCNHGQAAQSLVLFQQALADPAYPTPLLAQSNFGSCALAAGDLVLAEALLRTVLQSDANNAVALLSMAELSMRRGQAFEARAFIQRRLDAAAPTQRVYELAAQIESTLGDNAASTRYLDAMRQQFPQPPAAAVEGSQR